MLNADLAELRSANLYRELRRIDSPQAVQIEIGGRRLLNFSSNDYLGLANEPRLKESAILAIEKYGTGAGASRLICGSLAPFHDLEFAIAAFKKTEAALSFSTGYAAAIGTLGALLGKEDVVIIDKLVHASIVDAARLCGAKLRVFGHNDLGKLEEILRWAGSRVSTKPAGSARRRVLIVTESIFSMDGDCAPLRELVELKERYGAWLMVDEAHATGIMGPNRSGLADELGLSGRIEIQMGTLGKALGASGGFICGSRSLIDLLVNRARTFIFSTAPMPAAAAAAMAAINFVRSETGKERVANLRARLQQLRTGVSRLSSLDRSSGLSAIVPLIVGEEAAAMSAAKELGDHGFFVPAIRFPTVARAAARLRFTLTALHSASDVDALLQAVGPLAARTNPSAIRNRQ